MFWTTIQIVLGIITPFLVIAFLIWLLNYLHIQVTVKRLMLEAKLEEIKKSPPKVSIKNTWLGRSKTVSHRASITHKT